ncbi:MAG: fluoride efflux transporter FluC [Acidimicrobiales bacterium]
MTVPSAAATLPLVAVGGAVGALVRWGLIEAAGGGAAVLACNVVGSLILGVLVGSMPRPGTMMSADEWARRFGRQRLLGTGFCGGLTTLSTVAVDAAGRLDDGRPGAAVAGLATTVALTGIAGAVGVLAARRSRPGADSAIVR